MIEMGDRERMASSRTINHIPTKGHEITFSTVEEIMRDMGHTHAHGSCITNHEPLLATSLEFAFARRRRMGRHVASHTTRVVPWSPGFFASAPVLSLLTLDRHIPKLETSERNLGDSPLLVFRVRLVFLALRKRLGVGTGRSPSRSGRTIGTDARGIRKSTRSVLRSRVTEGL